MNSTTIPLPDKATWEAGRDIAAAMFRTIAEKIRADGGAGMYVEGEDRYRNLGGIKTLPYPDGVQDNICAVHIEQLAQSPGLIAGFGAMLTDILFQIEEGASIPDLQAYAKVTYEQWIAVPEDEDGVRQADVAKGAQALIDLMVTIGEISNDTCCSLGEQPEAADGRDYKTMAAVVSDCLHSMMDSQQDPSIREGFIRAMTDLICMNADGCGTGPENWNPIDRTEFAFSGQLDKALAVVATAPANCVKPLADLENLIALLKGAQRLGSEGDATWRVIDHAILEYGTVIDHLIAGRAEDAMNAAHEASSFVSAAAAFETDQTRGLANDTRARSLRHVDEALDAWSTNMDCGGIYHPDTARVPAAPKARARKGSKKVVAA